MWIIRFWDRGCASAPIWSTRLRAMEIGEIFGFPDELKFRSSMTLFAHATADSELFADAVDKYFPDGFDPQTLERL